MEQPLEQPETPSSIDLVPAVQGPEKTYLSLRSTEAFTGGVATDAATLPEGDPLKMLFLVGVSALGIYLVMRYASKGK